MTIIEDMLRKTPEIGIWRAVYCFWPICDRDGTWLVLTDAERRPLASGEYEYRALLADNE